MATKPTKNKQSNNWPKISIETEYFQFEKKKKTIPSQI